MIAFIKSLKRGDLHGWRVLKKGGGIQKHRRLTIIMSND